MSTNALSLMAVSAVLSSCCFTAMAETASAPVPPDDATAVRAVVETMTMAFMAGDIDSVMRAYEPGAVIIGEPGKPIRGDAALREMFAGFVAINPSFAYRGHEMIVAGDLAIHIAPWKMTGVAPDGAAVDGAGLSIAVMRRGADGQWRMVIDNPYGDWLLAHAASD